MLLQTEKSHIVNTASAAGLASVAGAAAYNVSKHGVVTMSETLYGEFLDCGIQNVGVSVLCPAFVPTKIAEAQRPSEYADTKAHSEESLKYAMNMLAAVKSGKKSADDIADETFAAISAGQLYIVPHKHKIGPLIVSRAEDISLERNPSLAGMPQLTK